MEAGWTPKLDSWRCSQKAIGFEVSIAAMVGGGGWSCWTLWAARFVGAVRGE